MNRLSRTRVSIVVLLPLIGVLATAGIAYRTVERVRIGSPEFDRVLMYGKVIDDTVPAPASLSDPYLVTIGIATGADASAVATQIELLGQAKQGYDQAVAKWPTALSGASGIDADKVRATLAQMTEAAQRFWTLAQTDLVQAVNRGDGGAALALVLGPLREAFQAHHDLGDRITGELLTAQKNQEAATRRMIEHERTVDVLAVTVLAMTLVIGATLAVRRHRGPGPVLPTPTVERPTTTLETRVLVDSHS